jgi:hypothetical protein
MHKEHLLTTPDIRTVYRLNQEQYAELEKQLPPAMVLANTTELQAGQMIGITLVMNKLRAGFVVGA